MEKVQLKKITTIINGSTPSTADPNNWDGDIPWITPKDLSTFHQRFIHRGERNITEAGYNSCSTTMVPKGTVLLTSRAPIGYLAIADNPMCTNQGFKSLVCDESQIIPLYLYYWLSTKVEYLKGISGGATFKELSKTTLENVEIALPSIAEQRHIVGTIGSVDDLIEKDLTILNNLDSILFKKNKLFIAKNGFSNIPLADLVLKEIKGNWGYEEPQNGCLEAFVLRGTDIASLDKYEEINPPKRYIKEKSILADKLENLDVVIEMSGGGPKQPTGRSWLFDSCLFDGPVMCSNFCRGIRCRGITETAIFYLSMKDLYDRRITYTYELGTTGIKNLNIAKLLSEQFVPNLANEEKEELTILFSRSQKYRSSLSKEINILKKQKAVLLAKYF